MSSPSNNEDRGLFDLLQSNKPQANAFAATLLIFITSGMFMNAALLDGDYKLCMSWFGATLIATLLGTAADYFLSKQLITFISAALIVISGILNIIFNTHNIIGLYIAYVLNGIATGLIYVPIMSHVGELSFCKLRGLHSGLTEAIPFSTGLMLSFLFASPNFTQSLSGSQQQGIVCVIFGLISLLFNCFLCKKSPIKLLLAEGETPVVSLLAQLQRKQEPNTQTYNWLYELKHYVEVEQIFSLQQSAIRGLNALLKVVFYRLLVALGNCWLIHKIYYELTLLENRHLILTLSGLLRMLGAYLGCGLVDYIGRLRPMQFSALVSSALMVAMAILPQNPQNMETAAWILVFYQFSAGLFMVPAAVYMTEAFPLRVKPFFIAFSFAAEMLLQLLLCLCLYDSNDISFLYTLGILLLLFFVCALFSYPETRSLSLVAAEEKFRIWWQIYDTTTS